MALFDRRKQGQAEKLVEGILNSQNADMLVVRGKTCQVLFMNSAAKARLSGPAAYAASCKDGYCTVFPDLCDKCPFGKGTDKVPCTFDTTTKDGKIFQVDCNRVEWLDENPATAFYLRDVTEQRNDQKRLYSLAYVDQLTGVPNRQRFREDFEALRADVTAGHREGVVAIFDIDYFKNVNDTYGHNTGDVMLRRLTEFFQDDADFSGHIYRLGGDEFVLMLPVKTGRHGDEAGLRNYYDKLLQKGFLSYTMPNIELSCTISMGVALFPKHGTSSAELLRKADIALYKAKEAGRNRKVFFEDRYDTAKKFKDMYINIQPILTQIGRTYGYELTDSGDAGAGTGGDALNLKSFDRTMEALGLSEMDNDARYFISFTPQLLSPAVLNNLPREKFVIQMEAVPDCPREQLAKYHELKKYGYSLALYNIGKGAVDAALWELADFCKFAPDLDSAAQRHLIAANPAKRFIALGVDNGSTFQDAQRKGFKLFQGYYFSRPETKKTKDIDPLKVNYLRLLKLTSTNDYVNFAEISNVISSDVALSYKLLRLLNSAAVGLRNPVSSIEMAVTHLGEEHLKKWIGLLALRGVADQKPLELVRLSLIRAQFAELLAPHFKPPLNAKHVFLLGMFSLLHIALEKTQEELFSEIPVVDSIRLSLLTTSGPYSDLVAFFSNYEYGNWDDVSHFAALNGLNDRIINDAYIAAVRWYNSLAEGSG